MDIPIPNTWIVELNKSMVEIQSILELEEAANRELRCDIIRPFADILIN